MYQPEVLNDIIEDPTSDWGDDGNFDDDDELDDLQMVTGNDENDAKGSGDLASVHSLSRPPTTRSVGSSLRSEVRRARAKQPGRQSLYNFGNVPLKRDPIVEAIIESRKLEIMENPYTRLAQTTSEYPRLSQRMSHLGMRFLMEDVEVDDKDRVLSSKAGRRNIISPGAPLMAETWDDGLVTEPERETPLVSTEKSCAQYYLETCQRLSICPCSMIVRSLNTTSINLRNYGLGPRGCAALAVGLLRNTSVTSLNLSQNNIGSHGMSSIYKVLTENSYIEEYDLSFNNLGTQGIAKLAAAMPQCVQIKTLNVAGNQLTGSDVQILLLKIEDQPNLTTLNLSHNQLEEEGSQLVAKWLSENNIVLHLDLSWCSIRLTGAKALAKSIGDNAKLLSLDLSHNSFTNDTIDLLANSLKNNTTLSELNLRGNQLICRFDQTIKDNPLSLVNGKDALLFKLLQAAATNSALKIFRLGKNHFDARCLMIILEALSKIENLTLEELDLTGLTLSAKQIATIDLLFRHHSTVKCFVGPIRQTTEHFTNNLLNLITKYSDEHDVTLSDMFNPHPDLTGSITTVTYEQFLDGLRKAKIPFPMAFINDIMKYLSRDNEQDLISLKSLIIV